MEDCVKRRLEKGARLEKRHVLPLDSSIGLICLNQIDGIAIVQKFIQGNKNAAIPKLPNRIKRVRLRFPAEDGIAYGNVRIVGKDLGEEIVFAVLGEET